ncbi:hypothetical protein FHS16_005408 [Paenibacillus endophyticus]|uniref:Uncharacterized protein n=1 Tax=Paenibacillus endophyticus TaxID=1294268 RepID=A0A7W5CCS4_9BACL|nr:hypothetical protein [Paenibacillus endophyticus]MBB3155300.1 hypothetical protein [Paenibacillus endophyticus]
MKMIKSKVVAGVVVVGMVASMGTVFAATNAGTQLQGWYTTATNVVKTTISGDFANYYATSKTAHADAVGNLKGQAQRDIRDAGNAEIKNVNKAINDQVSEYTTQINTVQDAITGSMPAEYDAFVGTTNASANAAIDTIGVSNKKELNAAIKNHKNTYLNRQDEEAAKTKSAAVDALNAEIAATKSDLNALLAGESTTATTEIQTNLNNKIAALQAELVILTDAGVAEAEAAIAAKGLTLKTDALNELDAIVQAIQ